jgi:Cof subfamily protein (haloacid dehalogenase superfamily)
MKTKLVIADIDGTLVDYGKDMMPLTRQALVDLREQGILLGIASGRPVGHQLKAYAQRWGLDFQFDVIIGMNGGQLLDVRQDIYKEFYKLKAEVIKEIIEMMKPLDLNPFVYKDGYMLSGRLDEEMKASAVRNHEPAIPVTDEAQLWEEDNAKLLFRLPEDPIEVKRIVEFASSHPKPYYQSFLSGPKMLEFQDPRVNKGVALIEYCQMNDIDLSEVIALGDASNDNDMLKVAGLGVCLKNGTPDTLAIADVITEFNCNEDGAGLYLYQHVLKSVV